MGENVANEGRLNWFERLIRRRRECPEIGFGELELLDAGAASSPPTAGTGMDSTIVAVHELAGEAVRRALALDGPAAADALVDLFSADALPLDSGYVELELERHGLRWLRVRRAGRRLPP